MPKDQDGKSTFTKETGLTVSDDCEFDESKTRKYIVEKEDLKGSVTFWLAASTIVISFGSLAPLGYNAGCMTVAAPFILEFLNDTNYEKWNGNAPDLAITWIYSCTVTIYSVGGAFGAMAAGSLDDAVGRKPSMIVSILLCPLGGLLMGLCQKANIYGLLFLGRLIVGLSAGFSLVIVPVYLAEISPVNLRGAVGAFSIFIMCSGQLLSHVIGFWGLYDQQSWPILLSLSGCMGILVTIVFPFCPESPRWLFLKQKRYRDAEIALQKLRGAFADINAEIEEMQLESMQQQTKQVIQDVSVMDILRLKNPEWKLPLFLCIVSTAGFHFSGVSAIFSYTTEIYKTAGLEQSEIAIATVAYSSLNVIATVIGVLLVDRVGRRPLLLYPFCGALVILLGMTVSINTQDNYDWMKWVTIALIYVFTAIFGFGPAAVKTLIAAELWLQNTRPAGISIYSQVTWWAMAFVTLTFPLLNENIGGYTFLVYLVCLMMATVFLFQYLPETKNRTFDEITANFVKAPKQKTVNAVVEDGYDEKACVNGGFEKETVQDDTAS